MQQKIDPPVPPPIGPVPPVPPPIDPVWTREGIRAVEEEECVSSINSTFSMSSPIEDRTNKCYTAYRMGLADTMHAT